MKHPTDHSGKRFGRLVAQGIEGRVKREITWRCLCDCGESVVVRVACLRDGKTRSCGCLKREKLQAEKTTHGMSTTREWRIWALMRQRCHPEKGHKDYGLRGITYCPEWEEFSNFYADMGDCPPGRSLDRIDTNGNYEKGNCRWATATEQNRNRRYVRRITVEGVEYTLRDYCELHGLTFSKIAARLYQYGWGLERALTQP